MSCIEGKVGLKVIHCNTKNTALFVDLLQNLFCYYISNVNKIVMYLYRVDLSSIFILLWFQIVGTKRFSFYYIFDDCRRKYYWCTQRSKIIMCYFSNFAISNIGLFSIAPCEVFAPYIKWLIFGYWLLLSLCSFR